VWLFRPEQTYTEGHHIPFTGAKIAYKSESTERTTTPFQNKKRWGRQGRRSEKEKGGCDGRRGEEGQNDDSMDPTAQLIRISFPSPSGGEVGVGFILC